MKTAYHKGVEVEIISAKGGRSQIVNGDGKLQKVRNGELSSAPKTESVPPAPAVVSTGEKTVAKAKAKKAPNDKRLVQADLSKYTVTKGVDSLKGKRAVDIGDDAAKKLRGIPLDEAYRIVSKAVEVPQTELKAKYEKLNPGMQRMNLGNRLRAALNGAKASA